MSGSRFDTENLNLECYRAGISNAPPKYRGVVYEYCIACIALCRLLYVDSLRSIPKDLLRSHRVFSEAFALKTFSTQVLLF